MIPLILAIASSVLVSIFMRLSTDKVKNNMSLLAANYLVCTLAAASYTVEGGFFPMLPVFI